MIKSIVALGTVLSLVPALAFSQPFANTRSSAFPLLSGTYLIVNHNPCLPQLKASISSGDVTNITLKALGHNDNGSITVGTAAFAQGKKSGHGTFKLSGTNMSGTPFLVKNGGGTSGKPWAVTSQTMSESFKQTASKLTIGSGKSAQIFDVYYGKTVDGIAQSLVGARGPLSDEDCEDDISAVLK